MISNERYFPNSLQPFGCSNYNNRPRPQITEQTLRSCEFEIEKKVFLLVLKENHYGRFLRIVGNRPAKPSYVVG
jgi:hypothetical protein